MTTVTMYKGRLKTTAAVCSQENYDEEVEAYKHHLEQTYRLCRPCQAAVEYYIKYQNRQLRTGLLTHQLRRGRDADNGFVKVAPRDLQNANTHLALCQCYFNNTLAERKWV